SCLVARAVALLAGPQALRSCGSSAGPSPAPGCPPCRLRVRTSEPRKTSPTEAPRSTIALASDSRVVPRRGVRQPSRDFEGLTQDVSCATRHGGPLRPAIGARSAGAVERQSSWRRKGLGIALDPPADRS